MGFDCIYESFGALRGGVVDFGQIVLKSGIVETDLMLDGGQVFGDFLLLGLSPVVQEWKNPYRRSSVH